MTEIQATRRYFVVLMPAALVFLAACFTAASLDKYGVSSTVPLYALITIAVGALFFTFWALWRFINEIDEFLRAIQLNGLLFGLLFIMMVATGWGLLEEYGNVPKLPVFWLNPMFWLAYSAAVGMQTFRARTAA